MLVSDLCYPRHDFARNFSHNLLKVNEVLAYHHSCSPAHLDPVY